MKKATLLILPLLLTAIFVLPARCEDYGKAELWVLIVGGPEIRGNYHQFLDDGYYCYYTMTRRYRADHITWLYWEGNKYEIKTGSINGTSTKANVSSAVTDWLSNADANDIIFIYLECHGRGYDITSGEYPSEAFDSDNDEGDEHFDSQLGMFGVDEALWLYGLTKEERQSYSDDELAADLDTLSYGELIVFIDACYGGGFIDDLSGPNRAIITSTNETWNAYMDYDGDGFSEFNEVFFDALYGYNTTSCGLGGIKDENPINADYDGNGFVSIQEAFKYAYAHDDARWVVGHCVDEEIGPVDESPWFDCDGNWLPTYLDGDILDDDLDSEPIYLEAHFAEPVCAMKTLTDGYFYVPTVATDLLKIEKLFDDSGIEGDQTGNSSSPYETISDYPDEIVELKDFFLLSEAFGAKEGDSNWNYMADINADGIVELKDYFVLSANFGNTGTYITDFSGVTVTFDTGEVLEPDNGFITIPQDAKNFNVTRYGTPIGAMIIFW